jgi:hypothetical protein
VDNQLPCIDSESIRSRVLESLNVIVISLLGHFCSLGLVGKISMYVSILIPALVLQIHMALLSPLLTPVSALVRLAASTCGTLHRNRQLRHSRSLLQGLQTVLPDLSLRTHSHAATSASVLAITSHFQPQQHLPSAQLGLSESTAYLHTFLSTYVHSSIFTSKFTC